MIYMKIAIIGAGACGLYLAKNLARQKNQITVFEKRRTIGKACCSGLFSARLFNFVPEAAALTTNRINSAVINFGKKQVKLRFGQPFFVIEHAQLDLLLAALATRTGANIRVGQAIDSGKIDIIHQEYDRVIGCDGALSAVRQYLKLPHPGFMLGIQGFEKKHDHSDFVETWATKDGFLWKIPRGEDIEWGIMEKTELARRLFDDFVAKRNLEIENLKSAIIPQGLVIPKNERITLCGDASGLTKPWSGGGVVWNLTQADILLKNFPNFLQYRKDALRFFSLRVVLGKFAKSAAYAAGYKLPWLLPGNFQLDGDFLVLKK